jgi:hypothetical protein
MKCCANNNHLHLAPLGAGYIHPQARILRLGSICDDLQVLPRVAFDHTVESDLHEFIPVRVLHAHYFAC